MKTINRKGNDAVSYIHDVNGTLFFWADNGTTGKELWKSNGTSDGTIMIKEIYSGSTGSFFDQFPAPYTIYNNFAISSKEINANGVYYFLANEPTYGAELWKSNGTANGTVRVTDINPNGNSVPHFLTVMGDYLYFSATDGTTGYELWKVHLANGNVSQVADINPNGDSYPMQLTVVNNVLYFSANDGTNGRELWKYDGVNNPVMVTDLNGTSDGVNGNTRFYLTTCWTDHAGFPSIGSEVFFEATNGLDGWELWVYDVGTNLYSQVADINPDEANSDIIWPKVVGSKLFFTANNGTNGKELWVYDPSQPRKGFYESEDAIISENYKITVFPNPAGEEINIMVSFNEKASLEVRLLDLLGKEMASFERKSVIGISEIMNISDFSSGTYIVEFKIGSNKLIRKFVKK